MCSYGITYFGEHPRTTGQWFGCSRCERGYYRAFQIPFNHCTQFLVACARSDVHEAYMHFHGRDGLRATWVLEGVSRKGGPPYRNAFEDFATMIHQLYAGF